MVGTQAPGSRTHRTPPVIHRRTSDLGPRTLPSSPLGAERGRAPDRRRPAPLARDLGPLGPRTLSPTLCRARRTRTLERDLGPWNVLTCLLRRRLSDLGPWNSEPGTRIYPPPEPREPHRISEPGTRISTHPLAIAASRTSDPGTRDPEPGSTHHLNRESHTGTRNPELRILHLVRSHPARRATLRYLDLRDLG